MPAAALTSGPANRRVQSGHPVRKWERRLSLSVEYGIKAVYARMLGTCLPAGRISRAHVNQWCLGHIRKAGSGVTDEPCITVKHGRGNTYGHGVAADGPGFIIQSVRRPLACGARVWIESKAGLRVFLRRADGSLPSEMEDPGSGPLLEIHVRQNAIKANRRDGTDLPCITIIDQHGNSRDVAGIRIDGPYRLRQVGAGIYITTRAPIEIIPSRDSERLPVLPPTP
jgi:hypothetical protein